MDKDNIVCGNNKSDDMPKFTLPKYCYPLQFKPVSGEAIFLLVYVLELGSCVTHAAGPPPFTPLSPPPSHKHNHTQSPTPLFSRSA